MKTSTETEVVDKPPEPEVKEVDENEQRPWRKNMKKLEDQVVGKIFRYLKREMGGDGSAVNYS